MAIIVKKKKSPFLNIQDLNTYLSNVCVICSVSGVDHFLIIVYAFNWDMMWLFGFAE